MIEQFGQPPANWEQRTLLRPETYRIDVGLWVAPSKGACQWVETVWVPWSQETFAIRVDGVTHAVTPWDAAEQAGDRFERLVRSWVEPF